jgi:hypothetical protein
MAVDNGVYTLFILLTIIGTLGVAVLLCITEADEPGTRIVSICGAPNPPLASGPAAPSLQPPIVEPSNGTELPQALEPITETNEIDGGASASTVATSSPASGSSSPEQRSPAPMLGNLRSPSNNSSSTSLGASSRRRLWASASFRSFRRLAGKGTGKLPTLDDVRPPAPSLAHMLRFLVCDRKMRFLTPILLTAGMVR